MPGPFSRDYSNDFGAGATSTGTAVDGCVVFEYQTWALRYPELAGFVSPVLAQMYFDEATLLLDNTPCSPVQNLGQRAIILGMLTAHVAALNGAINGQPSSTLVGRINSATEGSVSVGTELITPMSAAYFSQTKYGLAAWQSMAAYRTFRYVPRPHHVASQYGFFGRRF
jgi:Protein of unknown function (DUF4054)